MRTLAVILTLLWASPAGALTIEEVLAGDIHMATLLTGMSGNTWSWANARITNRGEKPLYCAPENLAVTDAQYLSIFNAYITNHPEEGKAQYIELPYVLLNALVDAFPCK